MPLFGGSAGDGTRFETVLVRSHCLIRVFTLNHFTPTDQRMVVTSADPSHRIVYTKNAEPAARELARILGKDTNQIDTFTFASNPVVIGFGGDHHVRAIKRATEHGHLEFFSAIDESSVLALANAEDMVDHLSGKLAAMSEGGAPNSIIACDCILRRIEAQQKQKSRALSDVLSKYNVTGFSTYGAQTETLHVNQTMTGVAIHPPEDAA